MGASKKRISWFGQVKVYTGKCFRLFINEKQWKNFVTAFVLILIIILVTSKDMFRDYPDTKNGLFTIICGCIWVGLFNSIQSICRERAIIKREHRTGLRLSSYITAHAIYEAFLCAIETLIILVMVYIKDAINGGYITTDGLVFVPFLDYYITFFLVVYGADTIAMFVSSLVRKENTAMTIMPFVLIVQLVMSDAIFPLEGAGEAFSNITTSKWGLEAALRISNTSSVLYGTEMDKFNERMNPRSFQWSQAYLQNMGDTSPEAGRLWLAWFIMLLLIAVFLIGSMLILRLVDKDKRI